MNSGRTHATTSAGAPNSGKPGSHNRAPLLAAATVFGIYLCYRLALPFLSALAWALALAVVSAPFHRWLESKLKHPNLAAMLCVLAVCLIAVIPATFVGQQIVQEAAKGAHLVAERVGSGDWRRAIEARPKIAFLVAKIEREVDLPGTVQTFAAWLTITARSIVQCSVIQVMGFLLTFYLLFFFLRDHRAGLRILRSRSPLTEAELDRLFRRVGDTVWATVCGTLTVSAAQGLLGGLMFWWLGLPVPLLWGVVMAVLAVVPVLGAFVIWIPAAIVLALDGSWGKALILAVWGGVVISTVDNLLRPILVGKRLKLHTVLVLVSVVGGLMMFGASGLILGPVVLTSTAVLLDIWRTRTAVEAAATRPVPAIGDA